MARPETNGKQESALVSDGKQRGATGCKRATTKLWRRQRNFGSIVPIGACAEAATAIRTAGRRSEICVDPIGSTAVLKQGEPAPDVNPRLVTGPAASRYLGGERPERFGVEAIQGKRQRLYDRHAIDAALDRIAGLASLAKADSTQADPLVMLVEEWR